MAIYEYKQNTLMQLSETNFNAEKIYERKDLQQILKKNISILSADLIVIAEEYGEWVDSNRRIDLLCIDTSANLVVVELKRTEDGGHMELQSLRYAAMVSKMTFKQLIEAHRKHLTQTDQDPDSAESVILSFLKWDSANDADFAKSVRIVLGSADFSKELTTCVLWLIEQEIDITCIRFKAYRTDEGKVLFDVQQIIPLPEALDYQTQIREKVLEEKQSQIERCDLQYKFWDDLLNHAKTKTDLHIGRKPSKYHWVGGSTGIKGIGLNYGTRETESQVELYIDVGDSYKNKEIFHLLELNKDEISQSLPGVDWYELPNKRACRILKKISGGWKSDRREWSGIHVNMTEAMILLEQTFRPYLAKITPIK